MATNPIYFAFYDASSVLVDMTGKMDIQGYGLNRADVYQTWTDGNWLDHRDVVRTRISGAVKLGFSSEADYRSFLENLAAAATADGSVHVKAYVNNVRTVCDFYAFIDTAGAGKWDLTNSRQWQAVTLTVSER